MPHIAEGEATNKNTPCAYSGNCTIVALMIQTLGDIFLLVAIISLGLVSFLFVVFLYHLIFVVMDLRQLMKRLNDLSAELEEMLMKPVEVMAQVMNWAQKVLWDIYVVDNRRPKKAKKGKKKGKKEKKKRKKGAKV